MKRLLKQKPKRFKNTKSVIIIIIATFIVLMIVLKIEDIQTTMMFADFAAKQLDNQNQLMQQMIQQNQQLIDQNSNLKKQVSIPDEQKITLKIRNVFPDNAVKVALMIAKDESGLRASNMNWNCTPPNSNGACFPWDRARAWSVDCGIFQLNFKGTECPKEAFNVDWNIQKAFEWKYNPKKSWGAWVTYTTNRYLRNNDWAENVLNKQQELIALGVIQ